MASVYKPGVDSAIKGRKWSRLPSESAKAYAAFLIYLELGENRTQKAVADKLQKSTTLIYRWGTLYGWPERAAAYDTWMHQDRTAVLIVKRRREALRAAEWEPRMRFACGTAA